MFALFNLPLPAEERERALPLLFVSGPRTHFPSHVLPFLLGQDRRQERRFPLHPLLRVMVFSSVACPPGSPCARQGAASQRGQATGTSIQLQWERERGARGAPFLYPANSAEAGQNPWAVEKGSWWWVRGVCPHYLSCFCKAKLLKSSCESPIAHVMEPGGSNPPASD